MFNPFTERKVKRLDETLFRATLSTSRYVSPFEIQDAINQLGRIRSKRAIDPLIRVLKEGRETNYQEGAAFALGNFKDVRAAGALCDSLARWKKHDDGRLAALFSLTKVGGPEQTEALMSAFRDVDYSNWEVDLIALALAKIGGERALIFLKEMTTDREAAKSRAATCALAVIHSDISGSGSERHRAFLMMGGTILYIASRMVSRQSEDSLPIHRLKIEDFGGLSLASWTVHDGKQRESIDWNEAAKIVKETLKLLGLSIAPHSYVSDSQQGTYSRLWRLRDTTGQELEGSPTATGSPARMTSPSPGQEEWLVDLRAPKEREMASDHNQNMNKSPKPVECKISSLNSLGW